MKLLTVNATDLAAITALNALTPYRKIQPVQMSNGTYVLNADLLDSCASSQIWAPHWEILGRLPRIEGDISASKVLTVTQTGHSTTKKPVGIHWYPGWKPNPTHQWGSPWNNPDTAFWWKDSYPEREPLQGWYNEGLQSEVDRCLGYLGAHSVPFVCFNWFWSGVDGISPAEHALNFVMTSTVNTVKFCIGWDPQTTPVPVRNTTDLDAILARWNVVIANSKYYRYNGKPVIYLNKIETISDVVAVNCGRTQTQLISYIRAGLSEPVYLIVGGPALSHWAGNSATWGYDGYSPYNMFWRFTDPDTGVAGPMPTNFAEHHANYVYSWDWFLGKLTNDLWLPMICGFDDRPWAGNYVSNATDAELDVHFKAAVLRLANNKCKGGMICAATEYGEGSIMMPTKASSRNRLELFKANFG